MNRRVLSVGLTTLAMLGAGSAAALQPKPGTPPVQPLPRPVPSGPKTSDMSPPRTPTKPPAKPEAAGERFTTADQLLTGLETANRDLTSLRAQIQYTRDSGRLEGAVQTVRRGTIHYAAKLPGVGAAAPDAKGPARRGFSVRFNEMIVDQAKRDERREFVFDGEWLVEKYPGEKQFFKRRIVPPGEVADPLRIGEGPFPIPIGQKREDIQARFDTTLVDPMEGIPDNQPRTKKIIEEDSAYQLKLIPKAGTDEAREFKEIRLWYRSKDLLPRMAQTINRENGTAQVVLIELVRNEPVDPKLFDTTPPKKEDGWQIEVDEFRKRVDEKP